MEIIDARGKACPMPVVLTKKAMENNTTLTVLVDNEIAVANLEKLAKNQQWSAKVSQENGAFTLLLSNDAAAKPTDDPSSEKNESLTDTAIFVGSQVLGKGDDQLGGNLMRMFFYTLRESDSLPSVVLFMNGGVKLTVEDEQVQEHLRVLLGRGVRVLVCGACLNFYGSDLTKVVGTVSNMYDILGEMQRAEKVITL